MSDANLAVVRECYARVSRRELPNELVDLDAEVLQTSRLVDTQRTFRGREGMAQMLQELWDAFGEIRWEEITMEPAGDNVVALMRVVAKGQGSGIETEVMVAHVFSLRDGKIVRFEAAASVDEAYRLAGIAYPA